MSGGEPQNDFTELSIPAEHF